MTTRIMLDRWSQRFDERRTIADFWDWLTRRYPGAELIDVHIDRALDEYHEIDQAQLERERCELIETQRRLIGQSQVDK